MSVSTISNGTRQFRRSPSSILSSDSDIRFTRKKLSSQYKCGCCIIACFLLLLLLASVAVYVGYTFFAAQFPEEQIFRATFRVIEGDTFSPELADPSTDKFKDRSRDYKERLNLLFKRSSIKHGFVGTEVLALDGEEGKDLIVHFNIHVNPDYADVEAKDLEKIMSDEISLAESLYFRNLTIDSSSVEVKPSDLITTIVSTTSLPTTAKSLPVTSTPPKPRRCTPLGLAYCSSMGTNYTTYPNILGHQNLDAVESDVISFRELVDAECYRHAYKFVCQILQPSCQRDGDKVDMVLPCRSFCKDFMVGCGSRLPSRFKELLDCKNFPEYGQARNCITKPDCVQDLQARALSPRICDGVADCQDLSDERSCTYCPKNSIHCGIGRACIPADKRCDGRKDCPDGSDERGCLNIAPSVADMKRINTVTPHAPRYYPSGFVVFNEKGEIGKLCTENLNKTLPPNVTEEILYTAASSLCNTLSYKGVRFVQIVKDPEPNISYVSMKNPTSSEITFVRTLCPSREVLKVSCEDIECGIQTTHSTYQGLSKMSVHGDWPWHVALFKEDVHICDGTLVSPEWIVTTTSCFQGQSKAEWRAKFGSVRLSSMSPWEQERTIVGMVKSPVEGSTIAMIKLDQPVFINDFVRPVCLLDKRISVREEYITNNCNTLGWARNREHLQRVQIQATDMDKCENISISSVNGMCAEPAFGQNDCNEEEFAGSPMLCLVSDDLKWSLIGVTNWRIGCSTLADQRPRMYDKISSNVDWIKETISAVS